MEPPSAALCALVVAAYAAWPAVLGSVAWKGDKASAAHKVMAGAHGALLAVAPALAAMTLL